MRLTDRVWPLLKRLLTSLPWLIFLGWAASYSLWAALLIYIAFDRLILDRYWIPKTLGGNS